MKAFITTTIIAINLVAPAQAPMPQLAPPSTTNSFSRYHPSGGIARLPRLAKQPTSQLNATTVATRVTEIGPHHRVWQRVSVGTNGLGRELWRTNSYTELETGMHYLKDGNWLESVAKIDLLPNNAGAIASKGQHKVIFPPEIKAGVIELQKPDQQWLRSRVLGLAYFDGATGKSVLIAKVKESAGQLVGDNTVIYPDAFTDGCLADIKYHYSLSGFSQDVVIRSQITDPESFGLSRTSTRLQVITEFVEAPAPAKEQRQAGGLADLSLGFGQMTIGAGKAFSVDAAGDTTGEVPVAKEWTPLTLDGRDFLIEQVPYEKVADQLRQLPAPDKYRGAGLQRGGTGENVIAALRKSLPERQAKTGLKPVIKRMAKATPKSSPGFVLDYVVTLTSQSDFTLKGDTTYYVSGHFVLSGTTTIEGGTVVKFLDDAMTGINFTGPLYCKTAAYRPAVFTSKNDDSIGELIADSNHNPVKSTGNIYLLGAGYQNNSYKYLRFKYAGTAVQDPYLYDVWHCQFLNCNVGLLKTSFSGNVALRNVLFAQCTTCVAAGSGAHAVDGQHLTVDGCSTFAGSGVSSGTILNSLFTAVTTVGNVTLPSPSQNISSSSGVYQTVGAASYYLAANSPRRNIGTPSINATLATDLKQRTTYPPIEFPRFMEVTGELTLFPQVPRYVSGNPDLGYYYDVLDYTIAAMFVEGGTINVMPGTAVGFREELAPEEWWPWAYTQSGINLLKGSTLTSHGMPERPNVFTDVQLVQEAAVFPVAYLFLADRLTYLDPDDPNTLPPPTMDCRFSMFSVSSEWYHFYSGDLITWGPAINLSLRDCNLFGGWFWLGKEYYAIQPPCSLRCVNNLFDRVKFNVDPNHLDDLWDPILYVDLDFEARNNLFRAGGLRLVSVPELNWVVKDNLFYKEEFLQPMTQGLEHDYNAYWPLLSSELQWGGTARLDSAGMHDQVLATAPVFQKSALGDYYLALSSPLYNTSKRGSRTPADAGLYHYTTKTAQTKDGEQTGNVLIGRHYVATTNSTSTQPRDSETPAGDGVPDYVEDINGNGDPNDVLAGLETDPALAMTDGTTPDATSTIYDDIDLEGDGMKGAVERLWFKNPLASDNPLSVAGLPTGELTGIQEISLNVSNLEIEDAGGLVLMLIGENEYRVSPAWVAATRAEWDENVQHMVWHTGYDKNGETPLQIRLSSIETGQTVFGPVRQARIHNPVRVLEALASFGTQFAFDAETEEPNGKYRIWFYDQDGSPLTYSTGSVVEQFSLAGDADQNGRISLTWDLNFPDATPLQGNTIVATAQINPATADYPIDPCLPGSLCTPFDWTREEDWTGYDKFITLFARLLPQNETEDYQRYFTLAGANEPLKREDIPGTPYQLNPESNWIEAAGFPSISQIREWTWKMTSANKSAVLARMAEIDYRNLFFDGHGNTDGIGSYNRGEGIFLREIRKKLGNQAIHFQGNQHPYRLVFFYACCTGRGSMCRAFGIPRQVMTVADFQRRGLRSRAFIGSRDDTAPPTFDSFSAAGTEASYIATFFRNWRSGLWTVSQALDDIKRVVVRNQIIEDGIVGDYVAFGAANMTRGN